MNIKYCRPLLPILVVACFSCKKQEPYIVETVSVDVAEAYPVDVNQGRIIELETTDSSLLYEITAIRFLKEKVAVQSRDDVYVFDKNGKYLFKAGEKGQGPHEYVNIGSVFVKNDRLCILDGMSQKVLHFDENGKFIESVRVTENDNRYPVADIVPLRDGRFVAKSMFRGEQTPVPAASMLDDAYRFVNAVDGRTVLSGITFYDNFSCNGNQILYWEGFNDTIFSIIDEKRLVPQYFVDFGKYAVPLSARKNKDVYDLIDYCNMPENINKTATLVGNVWETDEELRFRFGFARDLYYTVYDKSNKIAATYRFEDKNHRFQMQAYTCYGNGLFYISAILKADMEKNPYLIVFDENIFQKNVETE